MKTKSQNNKGLILLTVLLLQAIVFKGQFDGAYTQYMFNEMFINPAYAGSNGAMNATLLNRQQWVKIDGRPVTTTFSLHGPVIDEKMGIGLSVLNEKIGVLSRTLVYGNYAYRLKMKDKGTLAMGLMAGIDNQVNKFNELRISNDGSTDPQLSQTASFVAPNFGTGLYYNTKSFYGGLSIPRMINNDVTFNSVGASVKTTRVQFKEFTYYITAGNLFVLNEDLKLRANAMFKYVSNAPMQMDLGGNLLIKEMFWAGLSYRSKSSMSVIVGVQVNKQFLVSYAYDYGVNKIQKYSAGSHEFVLNYLFSFKGKKVVTPRYF